MWCYRALVIFGLFVFAKGQRGSRCTTPNNERAQCVSIRRCKVLLDVIQNPQHTEFLRVSQCGYDSDFLVCCGSVAGYQNVPRTPPTTSATFRRNELIPERSTCGFQLTERILGGRNTDLAEFPWLAMLQYRKRDGSLVSSCGGTLINNRYILTAAHCVTGQILTVVGQLDTVRLGEWNTSSDIDCVPQGSNDCNDPPQDIPVAESFPHPDYQDGTINRYNDIGLIRLSRTVTFSKFISPICLPLPTESSAVGARLLVAGWGATETSNYSPVKLKVQVPVASPRDCSTTYRSGGVTLQSTQLCAGGVAGEDSCQGDSGGPLMSRASNASFQYYIEGIVSFGNRCGTEDWPGVYTKVTSYLTWIHNNVRS